MVRTQADPEQLGLCQLRELRELRVKEVSHTQPVLPSEDLVVGGNPEDVPQVNHVLNINIDKKGMV